MRMPTFAEYARERASQLAINERRKFTKEQRRKFEEAKRARENNKRTQKDSEILRKESHHNENSAAPVPVTAIEFDRKISANSTISEMSINEFDHKPSINSTFTKMSINDFDRKTSTNSTISEMSEGRVSFATSGDGETNHRKSSGKSILKRGKFSAPRNA